MSQNQPLPIALQVYTLREMPLSFDEMLAKVAAAGYTGVETTPNHGLSAAQMQALLQKHNLRVVSTHVQTSALDEDLGAVAAFQKATGNDTLVVSSPPREVREATGAEAWQALGRQLNELGRRCKEAGLRLGYHNHWWEMAMFDGKRAIDWLLQSAEPDNLFLELDTAWAVRGGEDVVALFKRYSGRCPLVHAKDLAPQGEKTEQMGLADVGHGTLNWNAILPAARAAGAQWYIVEHDRPEDPLANIRRSFEFLKSKAGLL